MNRDTTMHFRRKYDLDDEQAHGAFTATEFQDPSLAQQQFKQDADLNVIVERFGVTKKHIPPAGAVDPRYYGDFSEAPDLREALDRTRAAQEHFDSLPAKLRDRFGNDPVRLLGFVMDPENAEEAVKLGLLHKQARPVTETPPVSTDTTVAPE